MSHRMQGNTSPRLLEKDAVEDRMNVPMEGMGRARYGEALWGFCAFSRPAALPASLRSTTRKLSEPQAFKIFIVTLSPGSG